MIQYSPTQFVNRVRNGPIILKSCTTTYKFYEIFQETSQKYTKMVNCYKSGLAVRTLKIYRVWHTVNEQNFKNEWSHERKKLI